MILKVDKNVVAASLAGLLHDVGKVGQRAFPGSEGLSESNSNLETDACPYHDEGRYFSHKHVLYTAEFLERISETIPEEVQRKVFHGAVFHHKPDDEISKLIKVADHISSGMEREAWESEELSPKQAFRKIRLRSLLNEVSLGNQEKTVSDSHVHRLRPLRSGEDTYPLLKSDDSLSPLDGELLTEKYRTLWDRMVDECRLIRIESQWGYIATLQSLVEKYTWCVPSATNVFSDISLFDHLKTTAAIACCLVAAEDSETPFIVVVGDLGGIQKTIFNIKHGAGSAAKRLRARSAFVQTVAQSIANLILIESGMPFTNLIQSAGGKFYLLLPNNEKVMGSIAATQKESDHWFRKNLSAEMNLNMASLPVSKSELHDFADVLGRLNQLEMAHRKLQPLRSILVAGDSWNEEDFVLPVTIKTEEKLCEACGKNGATEETSLYDGEKVWWCDGCHADFIEGKKLPNARYLMFYQDETGERKLPHGSSLLSTTPNPSGKPYVIFDFRDGDNDMSLPIVRMRRARYIPNDNGEPLTFEEIAKKSEGRRALGVLKADVDNLGYVLSRGLRTEDGGKDRLSISRMTSMSRMLEIFFAQRFEEIIREKYENAYIVYSGGDDLLCFGPWNEIIDLAVKFREEFRKFTASNPAWTLSAGISIVSHHTPVLEAVEWAESELEKSKSYNDGNGRNKDALTVLGHTLPWEKADSILETSNKLLDWMEAGVVNTSKVRRLMKYARMYMDFERTKDTANLRFVPLLAYDIKRNWIKDRMSPEEEEAEKFAHAFGDINNPDLKYLDFFCQYALYGVRNKEKGE